MLHRTKKNSYQKHPILFNPRQNFIFFPNNYSTAKFERSTCEISHAKLLMNFYLLHY